MIDWKNRYACKKGLKRYEVGDRVKIRENLSQREAIPFGINDEMEALSGKIAVIEKVKDKNRFEKVKQSFYIDLDANRWEWNYLMFE